MDTTQCYSSNAVCDSPLSQREKGWLKSCTQRYFSTFLKTCLNALWIFAVYTKIALGQSWEPISHVPASGKTEFVAVHPTNPNSLFIGTGGNLYASFNQGKDWKQLFSVGSRNKINQLYFDENRMLLLTSEGLFESRNEGKRWKKIFQGTKKDERNVLSLSRHPHHQNVLYLGTEGGLFLSHDSGRTWQKETNELSRQLIHKLEVDRDNNELFIAGEKGLYRVIPQQNRLDRVYTTKARTASEEIHLETELTNESDLEIPAEQDQIRTIAITHHPFPSIAIGTREGVFVSEDEGNHWERLPLSGLRNTRILDLAYSPKKDSLFAATEEGVYGYNQNKKRWKELFEGLSPTRINRLTFVSGESDMLYAATDDGIYRIAIEIELPQPEPISLFPEKQWNLLAELFKTEPTVGMIQKEAIRYANVSNWKTKRWQWASRIRALVPSFSVGKNFSTSDTVDLDRGSTNEPDVYIVGPKDRNRAWDFDLNWNLSDLIWNSSQTSIDLREKSMVELRDDILSEVTRLYFERRRAQVEFILEPPSDSLDHMNQLLRIDELTANLDALTGGYLTKELNQLYGQHPEFQKLWKMEVLSHVAQTA